MNTSCPDHMIAERYHLLYVAHLELFFVHVAAESN